ncbi:LysR family transcriptional regulator [Corynebacterium glyciniphilum]|uniref:LysR family transcriptional regulator n=1 Tax=Corynebacterium glyciniphilum TaxID=1404244 RepID=UPI00264DB194|nr:LysR family transcriptional regulator [Corynebacterium glyciniphilum]MDN5682392.1 LysR family transcriptional regulator [Corynebacterium glyciniphilum]
MAAPVDLDWFLDLVETGNMVDTALATGVSQSTLSRRLAALERGVGAELFDRHGRHLVLNRRGEVLAASARAATATWRAGVEEVRRLVDPERGTVRLGFMHSLGTWLVPDLLREFRTRRPTVDFELVQGAALDLVDQVTAGMVDLAIVGPCPSSQVAAGQVGWEELAEQRLGLAVPSGHRWAGRETIDLADAAEEPFVAMLEGYGTRLLLDTLAADSGFRPRLVFESMELTTVAGLVTAGLGVALLPLGDPNLQMEGMSVIPLDTDRVRELGIVWVTPTAQPGAELVSPVAGFLEFVRTWAVAG